MLSTTDKEKLNTLWTSVTCGELVKDQKLITIEPSISVAEACETLVKNKIISALVHNPDGKPGYCGVLTYRTIMNFFFQTYDSHEKPPLSDHIDITSLTYKCKIDTISEYLASENVNKSDDKLKSVLQTDTLLEAVNILSSGVHRVSVFNNDGVAIGIISQSRLIEFIAAHANDILDILKKTLPELGIKERALVEVLNTQLVIEAMRIMYDKGLSGVAVVDTKGKIKGNLSLSDIKFIFHTNNHRLLWDTCENFSKRILTNAAFDDKAGMDSYPFFPVKAHNSLLLVLQKLIATHVHRLWIVDNNLIPKGVVSLSDVIRCLNPVPQN